MQITPASFETLLRSFGRGLVYYAPVWDPAAGALELTHLGDTEGDIVANTNAETSPLTLPEYTGPAAHEVDYTGENPVVEIPLFVTEPAMNAILSPSGTASAGRSGRTKPVEYTLAIFSEELLRGIDPLTNLPLRLTLDSNGGSWQLDGDPLTTRQEALLASTMWFWRGSFGRPTKTFHGGAGDAKKNIESVSFQVMHAGWMPDGHRLYTLGDPYDASIDLDGFS